MKYTPGPWGLTQNYIVCKQERFGDWPIIAMMPKSSDLLPHKPLIRNDEVSGNARLIVAAPTMFELLESALVAIKNGCDSESDKNGLIAVIEETLEGVKK